MLSSTVDYLMVLRSLYDEGREKAPVFDKYDFEHFTSLHENPLLRINHAFHQAINSKGYLPALIILLIDEDIFMSPELYLPSEIESHLRWIFDNIDQALKTRRRAMPLRSFTQGQPQLYVLRALPRFDNGNDPTILLFQDRHQKFNNMLQAIGRCFAIGTINIQTVSAEEYKCFEQDGHTLNARGNYRFWREMLATMNDIFHDMDRDRRRKILQEEVNIRTPARHAPERYRDN